MVDEILREEFGCNYIYLNRGVLYLKSAPKIQD
jgi:hypothetical protein